ncbi:MAG: type III toxin-antitoxin system ToxN/AbiQ family toxin [Eisenbergiella sp.]
MAEFENFGFYTIDADYLEYLNSKNSEVYYNASYRNAIKPFVGIIIDMTECKYFIPLTSAKEKHKKWKNSCDEHFLIYEVIDKSVNISDDVYKEYSKDKKMHVLSVLDIKKMIPVPNDAYKRIVFDELSDERYQDLFEKEYAFCLTIKEKILTKAEKIYKYQKETQNVRHTYCDFSCCENAMREWMRSRKKNCACIWK